MEQWRWWRRVELCHLTELSKMHEGGGWCGLCDTWYHHRDSSTTLQWWRDLGLVCWCLTMSCWKRSLVFVRHVTRERTHHCLRYQPSSSTCTAMTNLTVLSRVITPFAYTMHFHSRLIMHRIFLQTIKKTLHLPRAARTHNYWIVPKVHYVVLSVIYYISYYCK